MPDLLVRLYDLPKPDPGCALPGHEGLRLRRAMVHESSAVVNWVAGIFGRGWADECRVAFTRQPVSCYVVLARDTPVGFACHESTCRGFFGPAGVARSYRGQGIGRALTLQTLHDMAAQGYAYAIIGAAGKDAIAFYQRVAGATVIEGSEPGIYPQTPLRWGQV